MTPVTPQVDDHSPLLHRRIQVSGRTSALSRWAQQLRCTGSWIDSGGVVLRVEDLDASGTRLEIRLTDAVLDDLVGALARKRLADAARLAARE